MKNFAFFPGVPIVFLGLIILCVGQAADFNSKEWSAPASEAARENPVAQTKSSIAAGKKVYLKRCAGCHGNSGEGNGPDAAELAIDPANLKEEIAGETDGALFWKITKGKRPMPAYGKNRLSETERWNLINYIRTLARK